MSTQRELVLGAGTSPAEDELRLPREPGVIRRFWARHPLLADILLAILALLLTVPAVTVRAPLSEPLSGQMIALAIVLELAGCAALVWRRRWPVAVFAVSLLPAFVFDPALMATLSGPVSLIALYSVAVYRSVRACWVAYGIACGVLAVHALAGIVMDPSASIVHVNVDISTAVLLLIGALIGVNVGNRRRYLLALIDRSRQLVIERDQKAKLATASERARIAREMHDIVSHSLTVVVALAEGATATSDPAASREATRAVAATAREALSEMRMMLGVLRGDEANSDAPLGPILDASLHDVVEAARATGFPLTLTVSGDSDVPDPVRLAALRIVQEGVTNAMRYSHGARFIRVMADYAPSAVRIVVENDGALVGAPSQGAGWGLQGLDERARSLGGSMSAGFVVPDIWRLVAELPRAELPRAELPRTELAGADASRGGGDD